MPLWCHASPAAAGAAHSEPALPLAGGNARVSPEVSAEQDEEGEGDGRRWSSLVPELLADILRRVDADAEKWPKRRDVAVCACVCRRWREVTIALVRPPLHCGRVTLLSSLKQVGLTSSDALIDEGKFLLAAHRNKCGFHMEYIISIRGDLSHGSHVGKIKSNFTRTKFTICDLQPQYEGSKVPSSSCRPRLASKQIKPLASTGNVETGKVSYEYNLLKSRGPRRIRCSIRCPIEEDTEIDPRKAKKPSTPGSLVLYNKLPQWHEHLQCWCLNFHGRVMVASVKNFQLIAPAGAGGPWGIQDDDAVILQFGKIEDDVFTMDYRQPLSAFQAFAICLSSFGSKLVCE
ncbi:hypothetical protein U9M48_017652 [Paspalum notatum var. saurae]|uniref:Tubby C-terminal domain-containing protein n=1 Tax=Paspalum notatum var. saurae TaxID=547442 RepID=A0AAQ3T898_PASNO